MHRKLEIVVLASILLLTSPTINKGQQADQPTGQTGQQSGQSQPQQGGQQSQPLAPVSAEKPVETVESGQGASTEDDARTYGGAVIFSPRLGGLTRGYFFPSIQFSEMYDSNFSLGSSSHQSETINTVVGKIDYSRVSRRNQTSLEYLGGGTIYNRNSKYDSLMQQFGISQSYQGRRWSLLLDDRATYLPESSFGYGGLGFGGALGVNLGGSIGSNLSGISSVLSPNTGILTSRGPRLFNNTVAQVQYLVGVRSSMSLAVSYGFLRFNHSGQIGSRNGTAMAGFNHSFTARDNIGINYAFGFFRYPGSPVTFDTHIVQASYSHRISGRLSVQVGAGPQVNVIRNPIAGSSTPVSWSAQSSVDYRARRGELTAYYYRNTTNGGGVLSGATSDTVSMAWSTDFLRRWEISVGPGFSRNRSIPQTSQGGVQSTYNAEYVSTSLSRAFGRYTSVFLTYTFQDQNSNFAPCLAGNCGSGLQRHVVGFGFDFHPRQIRLD